MTPSNLQVRTPGTVVFEALKTHRMIAVLRTADTQSAIWAGRILAETGVKIIEVTFTVPQPAKVIETLVAEFPDVLIGAGTILEAKDAVTALGAGASFLVSPVTLEPLIQLGVEHDVFVLPGASTPSEIWQAHCMGAQAVKVFPSQALGGPNFIQLLRGPLPNIPMVATGGIELADVPGYLSAGAIAVGVGGPMMPKAVLEGRDTNALKTLAGQFIQVIASTP